MNTLAKLSDFKSQLGTTETGKDDALLRALVWATAAAERVAHRPLVRVPGNVEYPHKPYQSTRLRVRHYPIESVTSVKQRFSSSTDAQFDAETSLIENDHYTVQAEQGLLHRLNCKWWAQIRHLQLIYTGGFADPARIEVAMTAATWTAATRTLTESGAFAGYTHTPGDAVVITPGSTPVSVEGTYRVQSKTDNDSIVLSESISDIDLSGVTSTFTGLHLPGTDLQKGIIDEAERIWTARGAAGMSRINAGSAGDVTMSDAPVETLVEAAEQLRYYG